VSPRIATDRLWRTEDGRVVSDGDPEARFLLCAPGDEIPEGVDPPTAKQAAKPANKQAAAAANK
jgi:hypothetical protein